MKTIALIAHDKKKSEMLEFVGHHKELLSKFHLIATRTTGTLINDTFGLGVETMLSGPMGGDQQIGARVAVGDVDYVIFLRDPLTSQPHEPDINALLRLCDVHERPHPARLCRCTYGGQGRARSRMISCVYICVYIKEAN